MNDTAKRADTPIADIEMNTKLAIEELEKIVAPKLTTTTTKPSSVTKKQDWMPDDRSSAQCDGPEPSVFFQFLNLRNTLGGKMKGKHVVQSSLLCAAMMLVVAAGHAQDPSNTFYGQNAGNPTMSGNNNTGLGANALTSNTTGCCNTATGNNALLLNATGGGNTASGDGALYSNTTGNNNTATGRWALIGNSTGNNNTATGSTALQQNCSSGCQLSDFLGNNNTATGTGALYQNIDGTGNTATGVYALRNNCASLCYNGLDFPGSYNTATGAYTLSNNTTGDSNTAIGAEVLNSNTTGYHNTAIGMYADVLVGNLSNATAIGAGAVVDASNKIRLGDGFVTVVEGPPYSAISDKTKKENFKTVDAEEVLGKVRGLSVTSWNYIGHDPQLRHYGPVAQDFFAAFGDDGVGTIGGPTTISSTDMDGILMLAVQALENRNAELKTRIEALEQGIKGLQEVASQSAK